MNTATQSRVIDYALDYAAHGLPTGPAYEVDATGTCTCRKRSKCKDTGKHPRWMRGIFEHGGNSATTDPETIQELFGKFPDANVLIRTGEPLPDGRRLYVLDVDPRAGGDDALAELEAEHGELPNTPRAISGGGGDHLYFAVPHKFDTFDLAPGLTLKGANSYVIAAPSNHELGGTYEWDVSAGLEVPIADLPEWIAAMGVKFGKDSERRNDPGWESEWWSADIAAGARRGPDGFPKMIGYLRTHGVDVDAALEMLRAKNATISEPLEDDELEATVRGMYARYGVEEYDTAALTLPNGVEDKVEDEVDPPPLPDLLEDVADFIARYVVLTDHQRDTIAIWIAHTHAFNAADQTPYISLTSAEKRSGKTRLLECLELLVARPWLTGRTTAAALVRKVDKDRPTLLLDESDAAFKGDKEYAESLRGILNTGHRRGGVASLCIGQGANIDVRDFSTFSPKVIAGIGKLPDTVTDRSIPIELKRKAPNEDVERFRWRTAKVEAKLIADGLRAWASGATDGLKGAEPDLPNELDDRAQDGWEPLLAIAELAGEDWWKRAWSAALALSADVARDDDSLGVRLLADLRELFSGDTDRLTTSNILQHLNKRDESPWGGFHDGVGMRARDLANILRRYGITPRVIKLPDGSTARGYRQDLFEDAWSRYLPSDPPEKRNLRNLPGNMGKTEGSASVTGISGLQMENGEFPDSDGKVTQVTDKEGGQEGTVYISNRSCTDCDSRQTVRTPDGEPDICICGKAKP